MLCQDEADSYSCLISADQDDMAKFKGKRKRSFGHRLSENALRNWGSVAGKEVVVYRETLKHEHDELESKCNVPVFPDFGKSDLLVQEAVKAEITHPGGYINCANIKSSVNTSTTVATRRAAAAAAKSKSRSRRPHPSKKAASSELLPDLWFALGMHKRTPMVVLNRINVNAKSSRSSIDGEGIKQKKLFVNDTEFDEAVAETEEAIATMESEFFSDYFDDLNVNIQDASFTTFVDAINTDFTPEDLKESEILDSTNLFYTLLGINPNDTVD